MNKNCILLEIKLHFVFSVNFYQVFFNKDLNTAYQKKMLTLFTNLHLRNKRLRGYISISYLFCPF